MERDVFIDTSGYYACLARRDDRHRQAADLVRGTGGRRRFVTTDYVLDEVVTLLRARGLSHLVDPVFELTLDSSACRIEWMDAARFDHARQYLRQHTDHTYSFTDCFSFCTMSRLGLSQVLTKNEHFREAGFQPLLV